MKRSKLGRTANKPQISEVDDTRDGPAFDRYMQKVSAECYERSWRNVVKDSKADIWIAVCLYLILTSVAFVAI